MKNLDLKKSNLNSILRYGTYKINKGDESYSYFKTEYNDIEKDFDGNFLVSGKKYSYLKELLEDIKNFLATFQGNCFMVSKSSEAHTYFMEEYGRKNLSEDGYGNLIFPEVNYYSTKKR